MVVRHRPQEQQTWVRSLLSQPGRGAFSWLSHTTDLKIGTPVAMLSGAWYYRVSTGTGWPGVSILRVDERASLICIFYLSVVADKLSEQIGPEIHFMLLGH